MTRVLINQNYDNEFGEAGIGVSCSILESSLRLYIKKYISNIALHNILLVEKSDIVAGVIVINVPHMFEPMDNRHLIHMSFREETQKSNIGI